MITIRRATAADAEALFELVCALAEFEQLRDQVTGSADRLAADLDGDRPAIEALLAETAEGQLVGYALFFGNYSTFLTQPGLHLEDLFVLPDWRGQGVGKALLQAFVQTARDRGCGRADWTVLDWNARAIAFYQAMGAEVYPDWRICRVSLA